MYFNRYNPRASAANKNWHGASSVHKVILQLNKETQFLVQRYIRIHPTGWAAFAYLSSFPLEAILLGVPLSSFLHGNNPSNLIIYLMAGLATLAIAILLHFLIQQSAYFFFTTDVLAFQGGIKSVIKPYMLSQNTPFTNHIEIAKFKKRSKLVLCLTILSVILLAVGRAYILSGQNWISSKNAHLYIISIIMALIFLAAYIYLSFFASIWFRYYALKFKLKKLKKQRSRYLDAFGTEAFTIQHQSTSEEDFFRIINLSVPEKLCLERLNQLITDNGSFSCLVPTQQLELRALWEGKAINNLQVKAITPEGNQLTALTDQEGKVCLSWQSYESFLSFLAVGNKYISNLRLTRSAHQFELNPQNNLTSFKESTSYIK